MADLDINQPFPDAGHEAIRVAVVQAIEDLELTAGDLGFSFDLVDTLFLLLDSLFGDLAQATAERDQLRADLDALAARVSALEPPFVPDPEEP